MSSSRALKNVFLFLYSISFGRIRCRSILPYLCALAYNWKAGFVKDATWGHPSKPYDHRISFVECSDEALSGHRLTPEWISISRGQHMIDYLLKAIWPGGRHWFKWNGFEMYLVFGRSRTPYMVIMEGFLTTHSPNILSLLLSPYVTNPAFFLDEVNEQCRVSCHIPWTSTI